MTIGSDNTKNKYQGNDTTLDYNYTFKIFRDVDVSVEVRDDLLKVKYPLLKGIDYSVDGVNDAAGGIITLVDAGQSWISGGTFSSGFTLVLRRVVSVLQDTDIRNQGEFYPEIHEDTFDNLTMVDQQQKEELDRAITFSTTADLSAFDKDLPDELVGQPDVCIVTTETGDGFKVGPTTDEIANAQAYAIAAKASEDAAKISEDNAKVSEDNSKISEDNAKVSEDNAAASSLSAATSAIEASGYEVAAGLSAAAALVSEGNAATSETNAATSETNAGNSEAAAALSETNAATSETNAGLSETAAALSESNAASSESAASMSASDAATSAAASGWKDVVYKTFADSPMTIVDGDTGNLYSIDTSGGNVVVNLPSIAALTLTTPWRIAFKKTDLSANTITININGTDTIDGNASFVVTDSGAGVTLIPDTDPTPDEWTSIAFGQLPITGAMVGTTDTQTLSNKTLDNTNDITVKESNFTIEEDADPTQTLAFELDGSAGTATTVKSTSTGNRVVTLPDATGTLVSKTSTDVLTNKSIDADTNTITNLETDNLKAGVLNIDNTMASATDTEVPSAKAIKEYADNLVAGGGGANTALSNLAATAINAALLTPTDKALNIGSNSNAFGTIFALAYKFYTSGVYKGGLQNWTSYLALEAVGGAYLSFYTQLQLKIRAVDGMQLYQVVTPTNADTNTNKIYFKNDNKLYKMDSTGLEEEVGGASDLGGLTDVDTTTTAPVEGDVLEFDGSNFVPVEAEKDVVNVTQASHGFSIGDGVKADLVASNTIFTAYAGGQGNHSTTGTKTTDDPFNMANGYVYRAEATGDIVSIESKYTVLPASSADGELIVELREFVSGQTLNNMTLVATSTNSFDYTYISTNDSSSYFPTKTYNFTGATVTQGTTYMVAFRWRNYTGGAITFTPKYNYQFNATASPDWGIFSYIHPSLDGADLAISSAILNSNRGWGIVTISTFAKSWLQGQADAISNLPRYVVSSVDGDDFTARRYSRVLSPGHGFTVEKDYFSDSSTPGTPTDVAPTSGLRSPLFYVEDTDYLLINVHDFTDLDVGGGGASIPATSGIVVGDSADVVAGDADYASIAAAITAATAGQRITLLDKTFTENLTIAKQVHIFGLGANSVIDGTVQYSSGASKCSAQMVKFGGNITVDNTVTKLILTNSWIASTATLTDNNATSDDSLYQLMED